MTKTNIHQVSPARRRKEIHGVVIQRTNRSELTSQRKTDFAYQYSCRLPLFAQVYDATNVVTNALTPCDRWFGRAPESPTIDSIRHQHSGDRVGAPVGDAGDAGNCGAEGTQRVCKRHS